MLSSIVTPRSFSNLLLEIISRFMFVVTSASVRCCVICVACSFPRIDEVKQIQNMDIEKVAPQLMVVEHPALIQALY